MMTKKNGNDNSNQENTVEKHISVNDKLVTCPICEGYMPGCDFCNYTTMIPFGLMPSGDLEIRQAKIAQLKKEYWERKEGRTQTQDNMQVERKAPYIKAVTKDRPQLKRLLAVLFSMIKERNSLIALEIESRKVSKRVNGELVFIPITTGAYSKIQVLTDRIMRQWWTVEMMAKWTTRDGNRASDVIAKEIQHWFSGVTQWDNYNRKEVTGTGPFSSMEEQYTAGIIKAYHEARKEGTRYLETVQRRPGYKPHAFIRKAEPGVEAPSDVMSSLGLEAIAYTEWESKLFSMVDAAEYAWDQEMKKNPKHGTIKEMGRKGRELDDRLHAYWGMVTDVQKGKLDKGQVGRYLLAKCRKLREKILNKQWETGDVKTHCTIEANSLLWAVQYLGSTIAKNWTFFKEYNPELAGERHKQSTWVSGQNEPKDVMGDIPMDNKGLPNESVPNTAIVEYQDFSVSDFGNPEEAMIQAEEYWDMYEEVM